MRLTELD